MTKQEITLLFNFIMLRLHYYFKVTLTSDTNILSLLLQVKLNIYECTNGDVLKAYARKVLQI
jgi:type IV secretory pathway VirB3-like protein